MSLVIILLLLLSTLRVGAQSGGGRIVSLKLIDVGSGTATNLVNGTTVAVAADGAGPRFSVEAVTAGSPIRFVQFGYNETTAYRRDWISPYSLCGNSKEIFNKCEFLTYGFHKVAARTDAGDVYEVSFSIDMAANANSPTKSPLQPPSMAPVSVQPPIKPPVPPMQPPGNVQFPTKSPVYWTVPATRPTRPPISVLAPIKPPAPPVKPPASAPVLRGSTGVGSTFINCGGDRYVDTKGRTWMQDDIFLIQSQGAVRTNLEINGTEDGTLYNSYRYGNNMIFKIPVDERRKLYKVVLHFAET
jgi:Malectin domain